MGLADDFIKDAGSAAPTSLSAQFGADAAGVPAVAAPAGPAGFSGTQSGGNIQGVRDTQNALAQWLYNSMPEGIRNAGDAADHWLYEKSGGAIGTKPGLNFNSAVADQNKQYEASRAANGREGIDWARGLGAGGSQLALGAATGGVGGMSAAGAGVAGGAITPVIGMANYSTPVDFAAQKAKDIALGGAVGKGLGMVGGAAAGAISPRVTDSARKLMDEGMQLTPGQMFGGMLKSLEDRATSIPIVGDMIRGAQGGSVSSLNTAAYNRVLSPLREAGFETNTPSTVGREAVDSITTQVKDAYNSLIPKLTMKADSQLQGEISSLQAMAQQGLAPAQAQTFDRIVQNSVTRNFTPEGISSGKTLQGMLSDVRDAAKGYAADPSFEGRQLGAALKTLDEHLQDALSRSNPGQARQLASVNEAFANLARVQMAAAGQGAPGGVFTAAQLAAAVKSGDHSVRDNAYARGQALMQDLSDPAKEMLGASVGNSGTADRAMTAGALGALLANPLHALNPVVLGAAVPALAYTGPAQKMINFAAQPRSPQAQALADMLRRGTPQLALPLSGDAIGAQR